MSTWPPARGRLAVLAIFLALLTASFVAAVGASKGYTFGAGAYLAMAAAAVLSPAAITLQVVTGQLLLAGLFVEQGVGAGLLLAPALAGVVATAELLAGVARLDTPLRVSDDVRRDLRRTALAAFAAGSVFVLIVVAMASGLPGPRGVLAVALPAGVCLVLATWLARSTAEGG